MEMDEWKAALSEMVAARCEEVEELVKRWSESRAAGKRSSLGDLEVQIREWALKVGLGFMERLIEGIGVHYPAGGKACPKCGGAVASEGMRWAKVHTSMGDVSYERRYVVCPKCKEGFCALDEELGLDEQHNSPALQRMVSLAGTVAPSFVLRREPTNKIIAFGGARQSSKIEVLSNVQPSVRGVGKYAYPA